MNAVFTAPDRLQAADSKLVLGHGAAMMYRQNSFGLEPKA
jgi:hypothetical protein